MSTAVTAVSSPSSPSLSSSFVQRALNLAVFTLPLIMAAGAFVRAPRLPVEAPASAPALSALTLACAAPAPSPTPSRRAHLADEGCRESPTAGAR
jgi:hypothetical protein